MPANDTYNFANATYNLEHQRTILQIQQSKLNITKIGPESPIFAHVMNELKHTNEFLGTTKMVSDMLHNKMDISEMDQGMLV